MEHIRFQVGERNLFRIKFQLSWHIIFIYDMKGFSFDKDPEERPDIGEDTII